MKHRKTLEQLYSGYLQGQLNAEELIDFIEQIQQSANNTQFDQLVTETFLKKDIPANRIEGLEAFKRFQNLQQKDAVYSTLNSRKTLLRKIWKYTAIAAAAMIFVYLGEKYIGTQSSPTPISTYQDVQNITAGNTIAYLKSSSGIQTPLSADGQLYVREDYMEDGNGHILPLQNTGEEWLHLNVPRGGKYNITLSDSSKVFINSESTLSFPKHFSTENRKIQLTGEAYFEVSHNPKKPFIVETDLQKILVLGTHFNISAYPKEGTTTTLISGKVNVSTPKENHILLPGMQGITLSNGIDIQKADMESVLAWKNNEFKFINTPLQDVIRQLERWYNVPIQVRQGSESLYSKTFSGTISKDASFEELLKLFKNTKSMKIEAKEGRVYLMK